jgi:hypothetical protein
MYETLKSAEHELVVTTEGLNVLKIDKLAELVTGLTVS